jgi:hypothetical protein
MTIIRAMCLANIGIVTFFTSRTSANPVSSRFFFKTESAALFSGNSTVVSDAYSTIGSVEPSSERARLWPGETGIARVPCRAGV